MLYLTQQRSFPCKYWHLLSIISHSLNTSPLLTSSQSKHAPQMRCDMQQRCTETTPEFPQINTNTYPQADA